MTSHTPTIDIRHGSYDTALSDVKADLIFTSPPYNIGSKAPRKDGQRKFGKYDPKSYGGITGYPDTLPEDVYQDQQEAFLLWCANHLTKDGVLVYNHKPRRVKGELILPSEWFSRPSVKKELVLMEEITWNRKSTHNHCKQMMWNISERLYVFKKRGGKYPLDNAFGIPQRNDVWEINRPASTGGHACPFSTELAEAVILAWSKEGDLVCDPYAGSCTTGVAAYGLGRDFVGSEREHVYYLQSKARVDAYIQGAATLSA